LQNLLSKITIKVNDHLYLKDPETSNLGKRIIAGSIGLIHELGFEDFTFKKLAHSIESTEASVYRYFENKHKLLLYLISWYWNWMEYQILFKTANINSAEEKLNISIVLLTGQRDLDGNFEHINEIKLNQIICVESSKGLLTKEVDEENKHGVFLPYKQVVQRVSLFITEITPNYPYPHMLISTAIEGAHHQRFFAEHLPKLTDIVEGEDSIVVFYQQMIFRAICDA
jgi:AcrR family transcriptional regulator